MMPMTCYVRAVSVAGFTESGSTTRTPMEPGAHCQALLPPIWQRAFPWRNRWNGQKLTYPGALGAMLDLGKGSGPMNHAFDIHGMFVREAGKEAE